MGIFNKFKRNKNELRTMTTWDNDGTAYDGQSPFSLNSLFAPYEINEETAMNIPAVKACVDLISGSIAQMEIGLFKENPDGSIEPIKNDYRLKLVNAEPNNSLNGYNFKKWMTKDLLLHGYSYTKIDELNPLEIEALWPLPSRGVYVVREVENGYKTTGAEIWFSQVDAGEIQDITTKDRIMFEPFEVMAALLDTHDGYKSYGVLKRGQKTLQEALGIMAVAQKWYERAALPVGMLELGPDVRVNEEQMRQLQADWDSMYSGANNSAKVIALQNGTKFTAISPPTLDTTVKKANNSDIVKLFNIPENMISTTEGKVYLSIEQNNINYKQQTLQPIMKAIESAMDKALLLEDEKNGGLFFQFITGDLVRATEKEMVDTLTTGIAGGLWTVNEARAKVNAPKLEKDIWQAHSGAQLLDPNTGEMINPQAQSSQPQDNQANDQQTTQGDVVNNDTKN